MINVIQGRQRKLQSKGRTQFGIILYSSPGPKPQQIRVAVLRIPGGNTAGATAVTGKHWLAEEGGKAQGVKEKELQAVSQNLY
jgi:hypothetical protein